MTDSERRELTLRLERLELQIADPTTTPSVRRQAITLTERLKFALNLRPKPQPTQHNPTKGKTCNRCGQTKLRWKHIEQRWVLFNQDNTPHVCTQDPTL